MADNHALVIGIADGVLAASRSRLDALGLTADVSLRSGFDSAPEVELTVRFFDGANLVDFVEGSVIRGASLTASPADLKQWLQVSIDAVLDDYTALGQT